MLSFLKKEEDKAKEAIRDAATWVLEEMITAAEHLDKSGAKFCADTEAKLEAAYAALEAEKAGTAAPVEGVFAAMSIDPVPPTPPSVAPTA